MAQVLSDNGLTYGATAAAHSLFSIGASIAANAITVTLDPTTIAFRNTTLTTGTPTVVQNASQLSLTIASTDSFGLVTAYGNQRIAILAINNAGTMELAASALYGGVSLDETGVITTSTAVTTATGIKAANVRTGVAYKVVGFVEATFTTATGWGTLAKVQGQGGQALSAMSSLGYGQTWQSVTRTSGTTYYNTTGRPLAIKADISGSSATSYANISINGTAFGYLAVCGLPSGLPALTGQMIIPVGASYVLTDTNVSTRTTWELR